VLPRPGEEVRVSHKDVLRYPDDVSDRSAPPTESSGAQAAEKGARTAGVAVAAQEGALRAQQVIVVERVDDGYVESPSRLPNRSAQAEEVLRVDQIGPRVTHRTVESESGPRDDVTEVVAESPPTGPAPMVTEEHNLVGRSTACREGAQQ
jgi:hypothetical protein